MSDSGVPRTTILNAQSINRVLTRIAHEIAERNDQSQHVVVVGVQRGGIHLADRLGQLLAPPAPGVPRWRREVVGMHRDDLDQHVAPQIMPTTIPFDLNGKTVVLVDDVLYSGRTIRAALDALNDFGRPCRVQLAVLVDRGHRELPIKPDFVGKNVPTSLHERIDVRLREEGGEEAVYLEKAS